MQVTNRQGERFILEQELGGGGEARIWTVRGEPRWAAKIYRNPTPAREAKLAAMLAHPPQTSSAVAWPAALLYQRQQCVGFLMPKVPDSLSIFHIYHPLKRARLQASFQWRRFLHHAALNLATVVASVHASGHVIGDLNESNILVNPQALVTLVDTDSFQIQTANGTIYRSPVGKAEFTPPELQGVDFKQVDRTVAHDHFGLAVLIFHLLMDGVHPFAGVLTQDESVGRVDLYCMKQGFFPYEPNRRVQPPPNAPAFERLHPQLQMAFVRCFVDGHRDPAQRPTAHAWREALLVAKDALQTCRRNPEHLYSSHLGRCPECAAQRPAQRSAQRPARRDSMQRTNAPPLTGIGAMLRKVSNLGPATLSSASTRRARPGARHTIHTATQSVRRTQQGVGRGLSALSSLPERMETVWIAAQPFVALWFKWLVVNAISLPLIYLMNELVVPLAYGFWGRNTNEALAILFGTGGSAWLLGSMQGNTLRSTFLHRARDGVLWTLATTVAGVVGSTLAFAAADTVNPLVQGLIFGGVVGLGQATVLYLYNWPIYQRRLWIVFNAIGGGLVGLGWGVGASLTRTVMGTLVGGVLGAAASGAVTGVALVWMVHGTRFAPPPRYGMPPRRFRLHQRMRLRHHWRTMGAARWWLSLLLPLVVALLIASQSVGSFWLPRGDVHAAPETTQAAPAPPLPQPIQPSLGERGQRISAAD